MHSRTPEETSPARVLIVDDKPANLRLLAESLVERGYTLQIARSGDQALRAVGERLPDIILLDVNMPGTDGFDVCRRLKGNPSTREVPIIFVSALAKVEEKVHGLELGGVDYVTKPFQIEEVAARLETQLELKRLRDTLAEKVADLEDRNGRLNLFAKTLAHDLRGPLGTVMGFSDLLRMTEGLDESVRGQIDHVGRGARKMNDIIDSLLILAVADRAEEHLGLTHVEDAFRHAAEGLAESVRECGARIQLETPLPPAWGQHQWVERIWTNFLSNAVKYGGRPPMIAVGADETADGHIRYWVEDNGPGLAPEQKEKLFTAFSRLHPDQAEGIGLGLVIVQKIARQMGGSVGVEDGRNGGSRFFFTMPANPPATGRRSLAPGSAESAEDGVILAG